MIVQRFGPYVVEQAPEGLALGRDAAADRRGGLLFAVAAAAAAAAAHAGEAPPPLVFMLCVSAVFALLRVRRDSRPPSRLLLSRDGARWRRRGNPSEDVVWPKDAIVCVRIEEVERRGLRYESRNASPGWRVRLETGDDSFTPEFVLRSRDGADELARFVAGELGVTVEG